MPQTNTETPVWGEELKYLMNIGESDSPSYEEVTHLLSWEDDGDEQAYEPDYLDKKLPSRFVIGRTATISYEKDTFRNNNLDDFFTTHENEANIPVEILRVYSWIEDESSTPQAPVYKAKKAPFLLSTNMLSKSAGSEPVKATGSLSMADDGDWEDGTWNGTAFASGE